MKKILVSLLLVFSAITTVAQDHLSFKNIPIDGPLDLFLAKLKADGFTQYDTDTDGVWLAGRFAGKDCHILVQSTVTTHTVYSVYALFVNRRDWGMAKADYDTLKAALTKKYGDPISKEEFESPYDEDGYEFMHMKDGQVVWQSKYDTPLGSIYLYIKDQSVTTGCAIVQYLDKKNSEKDTDELADEL